MLVRATRLGGLPRGPAALVTRRSVVLGTLAVVATGCNSGSGLPAPSPSTVTETTAAPTRTPSPTPTRTPRPVWPLTGLPATSSVKTPALVVKIDNTAGAAPQVGLSSADLVVEELVEGGMTRLAAMFHSTMPRVVGPVRSVRTSDIGIAVPAGGVLAASGGARRVLRALDKAGLHVLTESDAGFSRARDRRAPYNVMLAPAAAAATLGSGVGVPRRPYLPWGKAPAGQPVTAVDVAFSGVHTTRWRWSGGHWYITGDRAADGDEFAPATVLVLRVTIRDAGYRDPAGNPVPETVLTGDGAALLLTGGSAASGRWSKASPEAPLKLIDAKGRALNVPAGKVWIELVPESGTVTTH